MYKILLGIIVLILLSPLQGLAKNSTDNFPKIKAAFIRDGNLWTLIDHKEAQVTRMGKVYGPAWSYDGKWISFYHEAPSEIPNEINQTELWVYNVETHRKEKIYRDGYEAKWSPNKDLITFEHYGGLVISNLDHFQYVSPGVYGHTWTPDGKSLIFASRAYLLPDGWTRPNLYKKQIPADIDKIISEKGAKRIFTLPHEVGIDDKKVWSINADFFTYSPSGKWISFIVSPTASWSMDSNMLCVLSNDGKKFRVLDEVILGVGEPKWAPNKDVLAFIAGGERLVIGGFKNKKLKWRELPVNGTLTPKNFAELDFTWTGDETLITSRVREQDWPSNPENRPLPTLYRISLADKNEWPITNPPKGFGDYHPQYIGEIRKLIWLRGHNMFDKHENLWMSELEGTNAKEWLKNVNEVSVYSN